MCLAVPGKIESFIEDNSSSRMAKVIFGGIAKEISLDCVPEAKIGDYVIVHAGFAISVLNQEEAQEVFEAFKELDEAQKNL